MPATITTQSVKQGSLIDSDSEIKDLLFIDAAVDVKGASGASATFDTQYLAAISWIADLTALSGGTAPTVAFAWEHSQNGTTWHNIATETALSAPGKKFRTTAENLQRYLRVSWTTTGTPTTATATFTIRAR